MKFKNIAGFLYRLQNRVGQDFSYNLCIENNLTYLIVVANPSSRRKFKDDKVQRIKFSEKDFEKESFVLINEIVNILKELIIDKEGEIINESIE